MGEVILTFNEISNAECKTSNWHTQVQYAYHPMQPDDESHKT